MIHFEALFKEKEGFPIEDIMIVMTLVPCIINEEKNEKMEDESLLKN